MQVASIIYNIILALIAGLNLISALSQRSLDKALIGACCLFAFYVIGQAIHNSVTTMMGMGESK